VLGEKGGLVGMLQTGCGAPIPRFIHCSRSADENEPPGERCGSRPAAHASTTLTDNYHTSMRSGLSLQQGGRAYNLSEASDGDARPSFVFLPRY